MSLRSRRFAAIAAAGALVAFAGCGDDEQAGEAAENEAEGQDDK